MFIVDTNILLDFPQIIEENDELVILTDVLRELDGLKLNVNPETAFKARRAAVTISRNLERLTWDYSLEDTKMSVDDKLLNIAEIRKSTLITNDVYLKVKATIRGIQTHGYGGGDSYNGMKIIMNLQTLLVLKLLQMKSIMNNILIMKRYRFIVLIMMLVIL